MIFSRKYVFETRKTRARRFLLNTAAFLLGACLLYVTFHFYIVIVAKTERTRWAEGLYQKPPQSIVVFTGDKGRLARALELLKKWPEAKMFISGVHGANTLNTLVAGQENAKHLLESATQVDLDYDATDTMGNVRETLEHLSTGAEKIERLIVVTSDYHVLRVRMIFKNALGDGPLQIYFEGIPTGHSSWAETKKLMKESMKLLRGWFLLTFG